VVRRRKNYERARAFALFIKGGPKAYLKKIARAIVILHSTILVCAQYESVDRKFAVHNDSPSGVVAIQSLLVHP
jgi:hypothetical protein